MSRKYNRKTLRASWSPEDLEEAMEKVKSKTMGVNEASRNYQIPSRTLRRHLLTGKSKAPLGRNPVFSEEYEKKLVAHIKKLERVGFAPDRRDVKEIAFQWATKLKIKHPFSEESGLAGNVWFSGFMARNSELSQRKSEGLSLARAYGVNRKDVQDFFELLAKIYQENNFASHPEDIYNMDESGIQVNNKPGKVIATKGAKDVYTLTSCEKGENVTVIACCNAEGSFLPPVLIYKGTYEKPQFSEGLPPGSKVFMNKKSSYINSDLFMKWFEEVFLLHKSSRKTLLILDGHSSHSNNVRLLEVAQQNNVTLLCLPSHTTHALQPLDRAFFRPLKVYFAQEAKSWMVRNKEKKLTRYDVSKLIGRAWGKAATVSNGVAALKSCGIYPYDPSAIPEHYFSLSDSLQEQNLIEGVNAEIQDTRYSPTLLQSNNEYLIFDPVAEGSDETMCDSPPPYHGFETSPQPGTSGLNTNQKCCIDEILGEPESITETSPQPGSSGLCTRQISIIDEVPITPQKNPQGLVSLAEAGNSEKTPLKPITSTDSIVTPSKVLSQIHPIPQLPKFLSKRKQTAIILTSPENIARKKLMENKRKPKLETHAQKLKLKQVKAKNQYTTKACDGKETKTAEKVSKGKQALKKKTKKDVLVRKKRKVRTFSSSDSNDENTDKIEESEEEISVEDINRCAECTEDYYQTQSTEDWIQCPTCLAWLHEFCTMYNPKCNKCGRKAKREAFKH